MKLISWNVNGLRAVHRKGAWEWLAEAGADIFCLQEIKAEEQQLAPEVANPSRYHATFNSSRGRKGYSGVATYSKKKPKKVDHDALPEAYNQEGRLIRTDHDDFVLLNTYIPNGGKSEEHFEYKLGFYDELLKLANTLTTQGTSVIICGDINVAHEEIDIARPKENEGHVGFLPEERAWVDELLAAGFVDTFRHFSPEKRDVYSWWAMTTRARERNVGWRIDYFFASADLVPRLKRADVLTDIYGSDHCPVLLELS